MSKRTLIVGGVLAAGAAIFVSASMAHEFKAGDLLVSHPWTQPATAETANRPVFMGLGNRGDATLRLTGAIGEALAGGLMQAPGEAVGAIEIGANSARLLAPGGAHVMLMGVAEPFAPGDTVALVLEFDGVELRVEVAVEETPSHE